MGSNGKNMRNKRKMGRKRKRGGETEKVQQEYEAAMQGRQRHWGGTPRPAKTQTNRRWRQSTPQEDAKNSQDMNKKGDVPAIDRRQAPKRIAARGKAKELRTEYIDDECRGWAHRRVRGIGRGHAVSYHGSGELKPKCATPALRVAAAEASCT
jgi:hypothetical protein